MTMNDTDAIKAMLSERLGYTRTPTATDRYTTRHALPPGALGVVAGALASDDWLEARFETPTRTPTAQGDVLVPLAQAAISGVFAGILAGVGILATDAPISGWAAVALGAVVAAGAWCWLLRDHRRLLRSVEVLTRRDDLPAIEPADRLQVEVIEPAAGGNGKAWTLADLPADRRIMAMIARDVANGARHLSSRDLASIPGLSRDKARELLQSLEGAGLIAYPSGRNHPDGGQWTARGRALARGLTET